MEITSTIAPQVFSYRPSSNGVHRPSCHALSIWHVGASPSPHTVNGVNMAIWRIASAQAAAGHDVHLPVLTSFDEARNSVSGLNRHVVPRGIFRFDWPTLRGHLASSMPDIVHIHSAFIPRQTLLGRFLRKTGIPYVVTPHGGLLPQVLRRDRAKKLAYSVLFEKPYVSRASGVTGVTPQELNYIRDFIEPTSVHGRCILNPISPEFEAIGPWIPRVDRPFILFLGRFDTITKGLDRLLEIARRMPEADFHLYGRPHSRRDDVVLRTAPPNVSFHEPVFGAEKIDVIRRATLYLQPSRWEAFSISVAEALAAGVPCALTETLHQAELLVAENAAFPLPEDPARASACLRRLLGDSKALFDLSVQGRHFARERLAADRIAQSYVDFYRELLGRTKQNHAGVPQRPTPVSDESDHALRADISTLEN